MVHAAPASCSPIAEAFLSLFLLTPFAQNVQSVHGKAEWLQSLCPMFCLTPRFYVPGGCLSKFDQNRSDWSVKGATSRFLALYFVTILVF